jgi:hypothetical protein
MADKYATTEIERWIRRDDRSQAPKWRNTDFVSMFGMCEMESGIADIVNKAEADGCLVRDVHFDAGDLKSDSDAFRELRDHGWLVESLGRFKLNEAAVVRIHRRYPNV